MIIQCSAGFYRFYELGCAYVVGVANHVADMTGRPAVDDVTKPIVPGNNGARFKRGVQERLG